MIPLPSRFYSFMANVDYPEPVRALIVHLKQLPGIGPKSAERIAVWLMQQGSEIAQIHMEARSRGAASLQDIWNQIASATSKERIRLVSKYSADF